MPIRYADDFLLLVVATLGPEQWQRARQVAEEEKATMAALLKRELNLELSGAKTSVTAVTDTFAFPGHHVCVRYNRRVDRTSVVTLIPKERSHQTHERIKRLCRRDRTRQSLKVLLRPINWILRGWSAFCRHAWGAKRVFASLDYYVWWAVFRWLRKKHPKASVKTLNALYPCPRAPGIWKGTWLL